MKNTMHEKKHMSERVGTPQYRPSWHSYPRRIITLVVLATIIVTLIIGGLVVAFHALNPSPVRTSTETRTFNLEVGVHPTLIVTNDEGFVHVRSGTGNNVTVKTTKVGDSYGASPNDFKVSYSQSGNTITVLVTNDSIHLFDFSDSSHAGLDVTVPANSNLRLGTDSRDITVTGIQGKMTLTSGSGALQATNVLLTNGSQLSTASGSITVRGSIGIAGQYKFQSNSGAINVTLPRNTTFHADLMSNSGGITNEFPITTARQPVADVRIVSGDVGSSPQAAITIQSDSGSIHLRQM